MRTVSQPFTPQQYLDGPAPPEAIEYAVTKVETALHRAPTPVLRVRLTLRQATDTTPAHRPRAQADIDLNGVHVSAHPDATSLHEAVDLMQDRLRTRLARNTRR